MDAFPQLSMWPAVMSHDKGQQGGRECGAGLPGGGGGGRWGGGGRGGGGGLLNQLAKVKQLLYPVTMKMF